MLSDFGIVFPQLCLVPSYIKEFVIFLAEQWLLKCKPLAKCLAAGTVEQILWVQIGQSGEEWVSWNPSACWI